MRLAVRLSAESLLRRRVTNASPTRPPLQLDTRFWKRQHFLPKTVHLNLLRTSRSSAFATAAKRLQSVADVREIHRMARSQSARKSELKRTIDEVENESDSSECVNVAQQPRKAALQKVATTTKAPLTQRNALQTHNKRRRTLSHVLVPRFSTKASTGLGDDADTSRKLDHTKRADEGSSKRKGESRKPAPSSNSKCLKQSTLLGQKSFNQSRATCRYLWTQMSYAETGSAEDTSEDDLAHDMAHPRSHISRKWRAVEESSDYEQDSGAAAETSEDDDISADLVDSSSTIVSEDTEPEPVRKPAKSKGKTPAGSTPEAPAGNKQYKASREEMRYCLNLRTSLENGLKGLAVNLPPLSDLDDVFDDMTNKALRLGLKGALNSLTGRTIRIATLCSGTESPLLAMEMVADALETRGLIGFDVEHVFSAEIVPHKQAYIERNFAPPRIFRDITEFPEAFEQQEPHATTAYGSVVPIPMDVDIVIAGTSCVDYSRQNNHQVSIDADGESGRTWRGALAYCKACRPAIVIFENIVNAAWGKMISDFKEIGYGSKGVLLQSRSRKIGDSVAGSYHRVPAASKQSGFFVSDSKRSGVIKTSSTRRREREGSGLDQMRDNPNGKAGQWSFRKIALRHGIIANFALTGHNVYRAKDEQRFGIIGCITPSAQTFISDAGRAMAAEESLILQGLPLDKISFTTETQAELQSLAGNAMSTTIIGPAILAALILGHPLVKGGPTVPRLAFSDQQVHTARPASEFAEDSEETEFTDRHSNIDLAALLRDAERSARKCYCEGSHDLCQKPLQECIECGHTTCTGCGGNPTHQYRQNQILSKDRCSASEFEQNLRAQVPLQLQFSNTPVLTEAAIGSKVPDEYAQAVGKAFKELFSFSRARRSHCWTVTYIAESARLDLVLSGKSIEWRMYALPEKRSACNDELRLLLQEPVARATVQKSLLDAHWQFRVPGVDLISASLHPSATSSPTWWTRSKIPGFESHQQPDRIDIEIHQDNNSKSEPRIDGSYVYLPKCGTSCDSLYMKKSDHRDERPVYLFLDPTRTGDPNEDCFVFSHEMARLDYDEVRPVLARIKAPWRPWSTAPRQSGKKSGQDLKLVHSPEAQISFNGHWRDVSDCVLEVAPTKLKTRIHKTSSEAHETCQHPQTLCTRAILQLGGQP
ncbi:hypothetical protein KC330_g210 [Hortaea werneckii]|nr:hypothetical protein KC330_g210 [Hortaea werneckii]